MKFDFSFQKLKDSLKKTKDNIIGKITDVVKGHKKIDEELINEIEAILIQADVGVETTIKIIDRLKERVKNEKVNEVDKVFTFLKESILDILGKEELSKIDTTVAKPFVIMVMGVNGVGKTTTIGKLAKRFSDENKKVLLAASDTFRAAAIEQLEIWANRANVQIVRHKSGADPASVAFDALQAAKARDIDVLIVDTAGRLHTKQNLMNELVKIKRVLAKQDPSIPHETLLVLDATTGQNAIAQAKSFNSAVGITGLVLAKLDGTAKGGIVIAIKDELKIPVKMVGIGQELDDLKDFSPTEFVEALFAE